MKSEYGKWVDQSVREAVNEWKSDSDHLNGYMAKHGFLVTVTFDRRALRVKSYSGGQADGGGYSIEWKELDRLYNRVRRKLLGSNYAKKADLAPRMIAALDVEGTRYGIVGTRLRNAHFHCIWVLRPEQSSRFKEVIQELENSSGFCFDDIRVDPIVDYKKGGRLALAGYVAKFCEQNAPQGRVAHDFLIFPLGRPLA